MAWLPSYQELGAHPKLVKLARLLGIPKAQAVGHLHYLWWWSMDYTDRGDLSRFDDLDIAIGAEWEGAEDTFVDALTVAGFLDRDGDGLRIHDWDEYLGRLLDRREKDAERKRNSRTVHKTSASRPADVRETAHVTEQNTTEEKRTQHNKGEESPKPPHGQRATKSASGFDAFWVNYPNKVAKQDAEKAWAKLNPSPELRAEINTAVARQKGWESWQSGYVPHPATFLNGKRWLDEEPPRRKAKTKPGQFDGIDEFERRMNGHEPAENMDNVFETTGVVR